MVFYTEVWRGCYLNWEQIKPIFEQLLLSEQHEVLGERRLENPDEDSESSESSEDSECTRWRQECLQGDLDALKINCGMFLCWRKILPDFIRVVSTSEMCCYKRYHPGVTQGYVIGQILENEGRNLQDLAPGIQRILPSSNIFLEKRIDNWLSRWGLEPEYIRVQHSCQCT